MTFSNLGQREREREIQGDSEERRTGKSERGREEELKDTEIERIRKT